MNRNSLILLGAVVVILGAFLVLTRQNSSSKMTEESTKSTNEQMTESTQESTVTNDQSMSDENNREDKTTSDDKIMEEGVKSFTFEAKNFSFSPNESRVKKGDKVKVTLKVTQGFHDFVVDEFNAKTKQISEGNSDTVEFTADKTGTFEFYCSVGNHRAMGMIGKLIVE